MAFVHSVFDECWVTLGGGASVGFFEGWAREHGYELVRPRRGDIVCFEWAQDNWPDHVGIVERVLTLLFKDGRFTGLLRTVEGNSRDAVRRNLRSRGNWRFARIPD